MAVQAWQAGMTFAQWLTALRMILRIPVYECDLAWAKPRSQLAHHHHQRWDAPRCTKAFNVAVMLQYNSISLGQVERTCRLLNCIPVRSTEPHFTALHTLQGSQVLVDVNRLIGHKEV